MSVALDNLRNRLEDRPIFGIVVKRSGNLNTHHVRFFLSTGRKDQTGLEDITGLVARAANVSVNKDDTIHIRGEAGETLIAGLSFDIHGNYQKLKYYVL